MYGLEVGHSVYKHLDTVDGKGVVERCAEAADTAVAFDAYYAALCGKFHEVFFKLFILGFHHEAYVHDRAVGRVGDRTETHAARVYGFVEHVPRIWAVRAEC